MRLSTPTRLTKDSDRLAHAEMVVEKLRREHNARGARVAFRDATKKNPFTNQAGFFKTYAQEDGQKVALDTLTTAQRRAGLITLDEFREWQRGEHKARCNAAQKEKRAQRARLAKSEKLPPSPKGHRADDPRMARFNAIKHAARALRDDAPEMTAIDLKATFKADTPITERTRR